MNNKINHIPTLLIVILILLLILQRECCKKTENNNNTSSQVVVNTKIKYDTIEVWKIKYIPKWETVTIIDSFFISVDTPAILKDYHARYFYSDTFLIDTFGYAVINDTISLNKIIEREILADLKIPIVTTTKIITNNVKVSKAEFYMGLGVNGNVDQLNYIGGELLLRTKRKNSYGLGLGVNQYFQPILGGRMYWKIDKWKKQN